MWHPTLEHVKLPFRRAGQYLSKHHKALPYIGLTVVFVAAVTREGFGEYWRRESDAVDMAQYMYSLRTDNARQMEHLGWIQREMQQGDERRATNDETGKSGELVMEPEWKAAEASYDTVRANLTIMDILLDKMPRNEELERRRAFFEKQIESANHEDGDIVFEWSGAGRTDNIWNYVSPHFTFSGTPISKKQTPRTIRFLKQWNSLEALRWDVNDFTQQTIEIAQQVKKTNERRANISWGVGGAFVIFGFVVGLLGKKYDPGESEGAEPF